MRSADLADMPAIHGVLAAAFKNDPLFVWIFPDDEHRLNATAAWLGLFVEMYVTIGRVDVLERDGEIVAVAMWRFPGFEPSVQMPTVAGLVAAFVGTDRATSIFGSLGEVAAAHSADPYAYLHLLAVSPQSQKRGLGRLAVAPGIEAADTAAVNVELATMNPSNLGVLPVAGLRCHSRVGPQTGRPTRLGLSARADGLGQECCDSVVSR